jgi:hypothetical protein
MNDECKHVDRKKEQEEHEELVVAVPNTIVDECAMVVETLHALVAVVAVPSLLWPQVLALNAHVVQMQSVFHNL